MTKTTYIPEGQEHAYYLRRLTAYKTDGELAPATIQRAQSGESSAQITVIAYSLPVIFGRIKKYTNAETRQMYAEDLMSSGIVGILLALDTFDVMRSNSFPFFARTYVEREIVNFLCEIDGVCKISRRRLLALRAHYALEAKSNGENRITAINGARMDARTAAYLSQLMTRTSLDSLICSENANFSDEIENI